MLGFSTAAWGARPARQLHRMDAQVAREEPPAGGLQSEVPDIAPGRDPQLGSHILAIVRRRLPTDWTERYGTTPVLIETFVETPRYTGAVYRASGWTRVGTTQGRGRYDRNTKRAQPRKDLWLRSENIGGGPSIGRITPGRG